MKSDHAPQQSAAGAADGRSADGQETPPGRRVAEVLEFLKTFPAGTRSRAEIDADLRAERVVTHSPLRG